MIVGDATETVDTLYPYYRLQEDGFVPVVAAPKKRRYQMVMHEVKPGWTITKEWEGYTIEADVAFSDVDPEDYLGIFFSGGLRPGVHPLRRGLLRITRHFFAGTSRSPASVTASRSRRDCVAAGEWRPCRSASSTWKSAAASSSTSRAWSTATSSAAARSTTTGKYMGRWMKMLIKAREEKLGAGCY